MKENEVRKLIEDFQQRMQEEALAPQERTKPWQVKELAKHYGCSEPTIYGMLNTGALEGFYIGKGTSSIRITPESVIKNDETRKYTPRSNHNPVKRSAEA